MLTSATFSDSGSQMYFVSSSVYPVFGILVVDATSNLEFV